MDSSQIINLASLLLIKFYKVYIFFTIEHQAQLDEDEIPISLRKSRSLINWHQFYFKVVTGL